MAPFGFTPPSDGSEDPDRSEKNSDAGSSANSDKSGQEQPDFAAMVEAFHNQVRDHFTKLGMSAPFGFSALFNSDAFAPSGAKSNTGTSQILPESVIRDVAKKFVAAAGSLPVSLQDTSELESAAALAEHWLDSATSFPARSSHHRLVSRIDWVDTTLAGWSQIVEPLARGLASAISEMVGEAGAQSNPFAPTDESGASAPFGSDAFTAILTTFLGSLLATQLGQSVGALAHSATGVHDIGLPLISPVIATEIPQNIAQWGEGLDLPTTEVQIFHALREGAVARLFDNNPWLVDYIRAAITEYGHGIRIDLAKMQEQAESALNNADFDINNPASFTLAMQEGFFTPEESPEQKSALEKLETVLALIDGWSEDVITLACQDRLPSLPLLLETLRRRRATSAPVQQLFHSIFGLHVSPRMAREATTFWRTIRSERDIATRDQIWSAILPTGSEISAPVEFLSSSEIPDDLSGIIPE